MDPYFRARSPLCGGHIWCVKPLHPPFLAAFWFFVFNRFSKLNFGFKYTVCEVGPLGTLIPRCKLIWAFGRRKNTLALGRLAIKIRGFPFSNEDSVPNGSRPPFVLCRMSVF